MTLAKFGEVTEANVNKMGEIVRPKWSELEPFEQNLFMQKRGSEMDMDWGAERDYSRFNIKQSKQAMEIAEDQFAEDAIIGSPRENPTTHQVLTVLRTSRCLVHLADKATTRSISVITGLLVELLTVDLSEAAIARILAVQKVHSKRLMRS